MNPSNHGSPSEPDKPEPGSNPGSGIEECPPNRGISPQDRRQLVAKSCDRAGDDQQPIELQPGSVYAIHVSEPLSRDDVERIRRAWECAQTDARMIVLDRGMRLEEVDLETLRRLLGRDTEGSSAC